MISNHFPSKGVGSSSNETTTTECLTRECFFGVRYHSGHKFVVSPNFPTSATIATIGGGCKCKVVKLRRLVGDIPPLEKRRDFLGPCQVVVFQPDALKPLAVWNDDVVCVCGSMTLSKCIIFEALRCQVLVRNMMYMPSCFFSLLIHLQ